ncbi:hypothetical protein ACIOFT_27010 [Micromonospora chalcea]|uniref:hypothetical protein n=2 Tax=Micromonospora TaxID=1873 RepID=UPI0037B7BC70
MARRNATPNEPEPPAGRRDSDAPAASGDTPKDRPISAKIGKDTAERAMNAFYSAPHGLPRWRDYLEQALAEYTERLEREHNNGEPFPQRPTDTLTPGRKVGISPRRAG